MKEERERRKNWTGTTDEKKIFRDILIAISNRPTTKKRAERRRTFYGKKSSTEDAFLKITKRQTSGKGRAREATEALCG